MVSTPSSAELYRFAMNFLLVRKKKRKRNRDGRKRRKQRNEVKVKRPHTWMTCGWVCESARLKLLPNVSMDEMCKRG